MVNSFLVFIIVIVLGLYMIGVIRRKAIQAVKKGISHLLIAYCFINYKGKDNDFLAISYRFGDKKCEKRAKVRLLPLSPAIKCWFTAI